MQITHFRHVKLVQYAHKLRCVSIPLGLCSRYWLKGFTKMIKKESNRSKCDKTPTVLSGEQRRHIGRCWIVGSEAANGAITVSVHAVRGDRSVL